MLAKSTIGVFATHRDYVFFQVPNDVTHDKHIFSYHNQIDYETQSLVIIEINDKAIRHFSNPGSRINCCNIGTVNIVTNNIATVNIVTVNIVNIGPVNIATVNITADM